MATHPAAHGPQSAIPIVIDTYRDRRPLELARTYSPFWHWIRFITATGRTVPIRPYCVILTLRPFQVRISAVATRNAIFPGTDGAPGPASGRPRPAGRGRSRRGSKLTAGSTCPATPRGRRRLPGWTSSARGRLAQGWPGDGSARMTAWRCQTRHRVAGSAGGRYPDSGYSGLWSSSARLLTCLLSGR